MAPILNPRSGLRARGSHMSAGAIAGTVIGSAFGGSLLLIVLGFLYFRYRRKLREAREAGTFPAGSSTVSQVRTLFPFQGFRPRQTPATQPDHPPSMKDDFERINPGFSDGSEFQQTQPAAYGDRFVSSHDSYHLPQNFGQPSLPPGIDFPLPPQPTAFPTTNNIGANLPSNNAVTGYEAANSSYYDTRISMGSNPEQEPIPPSRQMTELYEAQLRDSREHRRRSGSLTSRIWNSIKRKRSTHSSAHGTVSPQYSTSQQYFPTSPVVSPVSMKPESGLEAAEGTSIQEKPPVNQIFEEPAEISGEAGISIASQDRNCTEKDQQHKRQRQGDSQYDVYPLRTSSTVRETTERDPELPSAALRSPDSTDRLPHSTQPQSETRPQERLMSPAIPEPMELDETLDATHRPSIFHSSHSPSLQPESFVSPMSIMQPSNAAEKAAYTHYQMENSASPPTFPTSPPAIVTDQAAQENSENFFHGSQEDIDVESFLDIPSDDEPRLSGDSYDYSTTPGQSSTDPSMGRTPDTRLTVSPSPYPNTNEHVKMEPESSLSPEVSKIPSPQSSGHICEECGRYFDQVHKLNHHKRYHDRKHECPYEGCDKKFGTKTHLDRHINDKHVKSKAYHCTEPTCAYFKGRKAFPRKDNWRRHMIKKHGAMPNDLEAMDESMV
ncbi:putative zinc finger protein 2 protein [Daldinia childiae]|uniref:putative zinc finger protein 2 protein n=1 Tax=Daldinia childiae TaxID=326645 RepID=UPI0014471830|nr:putative zinc finger protein 2 protein [Daldinia childiae]KAF3063664.1 putative zinc finger protein 2 protein [Daldinia childiae]